MLTWTHSMSKICSVDSELVVFGNDNNHTKTHCANAQSMSSTSETNRADVHRIRSVHRIRKNTVTHTRYTLQLGRKQPSPPFRGSRTVTRRHHQCSLKRGTWCIQFGTVASCPQLAMRGAFVRKDSNIRCSVWRNRSGSAFAYAVEELSAV